MIILAENVKQDKIYVNSDYIKYGYLIHYKLNNCFDRCYNVVQINIAVEDRIFQQSVMPLWGLLIKSD